MNYTKYIRTCQECGYQRESRDPATYKNDSWRDIKCPKCKSEGSFDYGSTREYDVNGVEVVYEETE